MCVCSAESKSDPGLHIKKRDHQVEEDDSLHS